MRRVLCAKFDCEIFIAQSGGLSLNLKIYRSFREFIAQSEDLSLKHVSPPSQLIETNNEHNPLPQKRAMQLCEIGPI